MHSLIMHCAVHDVTCVRVQIEQLNAQVKELQAKSWQDGNCRSELEALKAS